MKMKVVVSALAFLALFATSARAQEDSSKSVDIFAGYSYFRFNPSVAGLDPINTNGGSVSIAYNAKSWLSGVADFGVYHSNVHSEQNTLSSYLFGPKISYHHYSQVTPFGQVLFGLARASVNIAGTPNGDNTFAMSVGGGVDIRLNRRLALRPLEADYLLTRFKDGTTSAQNQNNLRVSTGVVFHF